MTQRALTFHYPCWLMGNFPCEVSEIFLIRNYVEPCILLSMLRTSNPLFILFLIHHSKSVSCFHFISWLFLFSQSPLFLHKPPSFSARITAASAQLVFLDFCWTPTHPCLISPHLNNLSKTQIASCPFLEPLPSDSPLSQKLSPILPSWLTLNLSRPIN